MGFLMSIVADQVVLEFQPSFARGGQMALYAGLLFGALFWGIGADIVGRKWAFNLSLFVCAFFGVLAGLAPGYLSWIFCVAMSGLGEGGNLALDATVFLEFLPSKKRWLVTSLACWWGIGQTAAGLIAWPLVGNFSCPQDGSVPCTHENNMGWRYLYVVSGTLVLLMSIARVTIVQLHETPKYLLCEGRDHQVVKLFQDLACQYQRPCDLTLEELQACGKVTSAHSTDVEGKHPWMSELMVHFKGLFKTRVMTISVLLLWFSWMLIGIAYPLFYLYLPEYLTTRIPNSGSQPQSMTTTMRNFTITNIFAIPGPIVAGYLCELSILGRRRTMFIGAVLTMLCFLGYTSVETAAENLFWSCSISFCINVYYGTLYAYTPEALPSAHRATGYGIALALNRAMGILSAVVASIASTATAAPLYICAGILGITSIISWCFPLETQSTSSL
ncbi:major facilitator superfamily domain-containing protein [Xylariales sp. PMI_506]|nr:major facilitator superfamily domain-containing protein [Xylariales sp. PMI_506]